MSSMLGKGLNSFRYIIAVALASAPGPLIAQSPADAGRAMMVASQPTQAAAAVSRWQQLTTNDRLGFTDYAGFALAYPTYPRMELIRSYAERALDRDAPGPEQIAAFFDRFPPQTNPARARYALALSTLNRPQARDVAREAWRGGKMSSPSEAYLTGLFGSAFTSADHEERMRALLWQGEGEAAARHMELVPLERRERYMAHLSLLQGNLPQMVGLSVPADLMSDPGYVYRLARHYRKTGEGYRGQQLLATRGNFAHPPHDAEDMVTEMLVQARGAGASVAASIAGKVDDLFEPGTDISGLSYKLRDDYTSLMWLGGSKALWQMGDGNQAAPLFFRYGNAARTPQTRSKGFYWAGNASARAGNQAEANRYFEMAARYPEYFYGQLALERLGRPLPQFKQISLTQVSPQQAAAFNASPLAAAIRTIARTGIDWRTERYFFTALADDAKDAAEYQLAANLARELGLEELAVVIGRTAPEKGIEGFTHVGFPVIATPPGADYTMVHAIARQESEFDINRISHAGARGVMQLMPGTAQEQAGKMGMSYMSASLMTDPQYNIRLGDGYFARMMDYYGGSYPLAVAAYNAGPGNVNKWLRANGDPRTGAVDWLRWIEEIPIFETKNYVQRVIENAVVYEALHPDRIRYGAAPKGVTQFIGKRSPG
ncbi:Soluble lytic murein transglycosylase precursor [Tsuneonella dongtanensis]|uniref:Soluble lytic murein transglycosylase n=1 Tax=Tsuneonella dongtanensis TaxID=692370 RepID=A0A1B2ACJ5_9SPHN|nr:lytic transglycosylase domain-containing protein [Tsuneonella dongtanensis]ANY19873.1 Soluble lytic murein transglycosylase precursor [Tsuneonella dongtanensis]